LGFTSEKCFPVLGDTVEKTMRRSPAGISGSNTWSYVSTYHVSDPIFWGYSLRVPVASPLRDEQPVSLIKWPSDKKS